MNGADMRDTVARYETSLSLHAGCSLGPHALSVPLVRGTSGVEYRDISGRGLDAVALRGVWREREKRAERRMELQHRG